MTPLDETHDPARRSWVESANAPDNEFPVQNLPFGVFRPAPDARPRVGVAIGDQILDLAAAASAFDGLAAEAARAGAAPALNGLMSLGPRAWSALRLALSRGLSAAHGDASLRAYLTPMAQAKIEMPVAIANFSDFFASLFHATNTGRAFRPDNPVLPNYKYVPVAYHGRASSVRPSGTPVRRPRGQRKRANETEPSYGPSRNLDFELELGFYVGVPSELGATIPIGEAAGHIFGFCLLNDWSARDIQGWEAQPLGPFLAKSFATTVSPWVVTAEALAPFRTAAFARPEGDPRAAAASRRRGRSRARRPRRHARGVYRQRGDAACACRAAPSRADLVREPLLDRRPDARPPRQQWLQSATRRPDRLGHGFRSGKIELGQPPRTERPRQ